jgi:phage terminase large subunit-like protein
VKRADRNIKWIEGYCRIPEGKFVGRPVVLRPWQRREIRKIYANPAGTRRAIISFGRKNGKTALAAFLLLLHLCGPEHRPNSNLYSAAQSREQAAILFGLAAKCVRMSPDLSAVVIIRDNAKQLACHELGTLYRALSAEASTAFGLSPVFIVHDELGQIRGPSSPLYEALETATAAQENPLSIVISTQAPNPGDLLSILIDDAATDADPRVSLSLYTAPDDVDPFSLKAIKAANPAFGDFQNADEVLAMAEDARRMPSREPEYRNLILNQRVEMYAPFISRSVWAECGAAPTDLAGLEVFLGLDLSAVSDLTAKVAAGRRDDGVWQIHPTFWLPADGLRERARLDRVAYDVWHRAGFLQTTPGRTVEYEFVAQTLFEDCARWNVKKIAFDRWGFKHLKPWLLKAGFTAEQVEGEKTAIFEPFGQGFQSMSPAIRTVEELVKDRRLAHGNHPVLTMCAANAVVVSDPAGNRKLSKVRATGRIDGMIALAQAVSVGITNVSAPPKEYQLIFA